MSVDRRLAVRTKVGVKRKSRLLHFVANLPPFQRGCDRCMKSYEVLCKEDVIRVLTGNVWRIVHCKNFTTLFTYSNSKSGFVNLKVTQRVRNSIPRIQIESQKSNFTRVKTSTDIFMFEKCDSLFIFPRKQAVFFYSSLSRYSKQHRPAMLVAGRRQNSTNPVPRGGEGRGLCTVPILQGGEVLCVAVRTIFLVCVLFTW